MNKFKVGEKILCVEDNFPRFHRIGDICCPKKGISYIVRDYARGGILLEEIRNYKRIWAKGYFGEPSFLEYHFEPFKEEHQKTEYKVVEIDKSIKEKREEVIFNN